MIYEFRCRHCGRRFDVYASLAEKEAGLSPTCPACGSADVARVFGRVTLLRSGASGSTSEEFAGSEGGGAEGSGFAGEDRGEGGFDGDDGFDGDSGPDGDDGLDGDASDNGYDFDEDW